MPALTVNLDMLAVLRAIRRLREPDPAQACMLAELAGADGVSVQLRRDRKYIREKDLFLLKGIAKTKLIVEMPPVEDLITRILEIKPTTVLFVADHADSDSPVSPMDFNKATGDFSGTVNHLTGAGIEVGFFIEPDTEAAKGAGKAGASCVLINCSGYTEARTIEDAETELGKIDRTAAAVAKAGLTVYCGRGIGYKNINPLTDMEFVDEFIIGHAISARAMLVGYEKAVKDMLLLLKSSKSA